MHWCGAERRHQCPMTSNHPTTHNRNTREKVRKVSPTPNMP
ncbi:hypothetical protein HMPREF9586_01012 [Cutibacterium acnes HL083PA2]|nr:hypothetical protein HMPREF9586_01012 [Cutibacterium acnes HL083PA2]